MNPSYLYSIIFLKPEANAAPRSPWKPKRKNECVLIIFFFLATDFSTVLWKIDWHSPAHDPKNIAHTGFVKYKEAVQLATPPATKQLITSLAIRLPLIKVQTADPVMTEAHIEYHIERGAKTNA